jgi:hypothetical protein
MKIKLPQLLIPNISSCCEAIKVQNQQHQAFRKKTINYTPNYISIHEIGNQQLFLQMKVQTSSI